MQATQYMWNVPGGKGYLVQFFAGYVPLATPNSYPIIGYSVAKYRPHVSHFWANNPYLPEVTYIWNPANLRPHSSQSSREKCDPIQRHILISLLLGSTPSPEEIFFTGASKLPHLNEHICPRQVSLKLASQFFERVAFSSRTCLLQKAVQVARSPRKLAKEAFWTFTRKTCSPFTDEQVRPRSTSYNIVEYDFVCTMFWWHSNFVQHHSCNSLQNYWTLVYREPHPFNLPNSAMLNGVEFKKCPIRLASA